MPILAKPLDRGCVLHFGGVGIVWMCCWFQEDFESLPAAPHELQPIQPLAPDNRQEEQCRPTEQKTVALSWPLVKQFFSSNAFCTIVLAHFCVNFGMSLLMSWTPTYFHQDFGIEMESLSMTAYPYLFMAVASGGTGIIGDRWVKQGWPLVTVRKLLVCFGFFGSSVMLLLFAWTPTVELALVALCAALAMTSCAIAGFESNKLDIASPEHTYTIEAVANTIANTAGLISIPAAAFISGDGGEWSRVMYMVCAAYVVAGVVFNIGASSERIL